MTLRSRTLCESRASAFALLVAITTAAFSCSRPTAPTPAPSGRWVGTWAAALQLTEPRNMPPAPGLAGSTLRQVVHTSIGGRRARVHFSNLFGSTAIMIEAAHLARSGGGSAIEPTTDRALTFRGRDSVVIPAGTEATSDPFDFDVPPLTDVVVTIAIAAAPAEVTGHPGSRTTSYLQPGDWTSALALPDAVATDHWYILAGIDVLTDAAATAIVVLGNSITDGRGSGTNQNNRWPDNLARRLQANRRTRHIAVLNAGIGGNTILSGGLGPPALTRLERDVLQQTGARWLIVHQGVNDIGTASGEAAAKVAVDLIAAYQEMIVTARSHGLLAYGSTILPFGGSFYDQPERETARQAINHWIRTSGAWDAVIDFDAILRDPHDPTHLLPEADTGDHLHPNALGYRMMADAIDLGLFAR